MPVPPLPPPPNPEVALARSRLSALKIVGISGSAATPAIVGIGVAPTIWAQTGQTALPLGLVVVAVVFGLFCVGLATMAPSVGGAGMLYRFVTIGLGPAAGVGAGLISLVAYNLLQIGLYGLVGVAAAPYLGGTPWWVAAVGLCVIVAVLGPRKLKAVSFVLQVLLGLEVVMLAVYGVANLVSSAADLPWAAAFSPVNLGTTTSAADLLKTLVVALAAAALAFIGFETPAAYTRVARNGSRTTTAAMWIVLGGLTVLFVLVTFGTLAGVGADTVVDAARAQGPELFFTQAQIRLGDTAVDAGRFLFLTSATAAALALHTACIAYAYSLAAEGVLPRWLASKTQATDQPGAASLTQSGLALAVIVVFVVFDLDPTIGLFYYGGTSGALGILAVLTLTSLATAIFLWDKHRRPEADQVVEVVAPGGQSVVPPGVSQDRGEVRGVEQTEQMGSLWSTRVAPVLSTVLLVIMFSLVFTAFGTLLGEGAPAGVRWGIPAVYVGLLVGGIAWAGRLRRRDPAAYDKLGSGPAAAPASPSVAG